jgi:hypothetical protein
MPNTAAARRSYRDARTRAVDWVRQMLEDGGLQRSYRVDDR